MSRNTIRRITIDHIRLAIQLIEFVKLLRKSTGTQHKGIMSPSFNRTKHMSNQPIGSNNTLRWIGKICINAWRRIRSTKTNLEFNTVDSLMAAEHNSLMSLRSCNWSCCTINKSPAIAKWSTLSIHSCRKGFWVQPIEIQ